MMVEPSAQPALKRASETSARPDAPAIVPPVQQRLGKKTIALAGVALAGALIGGYFWFADRSTGVVWPLVLQGNVEVRQVNLAFKVAGRIRALLVDEGDRVVEGQSLAMLDRVYFVESLAQAKAQRDQAKANLDKLVAGNRPEDIAQSEALVAERRATLDNASTELARADKLLKSSFGTQKAYDDALALQRTASAQLNSAQQALALMKIGSRVEDIEAQRAALADKESAFAQSMRQLADAELIAPSAGVVLSRVRESGAIVNAGETAFVLSMTSPVWIRTYVIEPDLARVKPGAIVDVNIDAPGAAPLKGRIGFISPTAEFTPKTVETRELRTALVYRLRVVIDEDPGNVLRQGMPVTVSIAKPIDGTAASPKPQ